MTQFDRRMLMLTCITLVVLALGSFAAAIQAYYKAEDNVRMSARNAVLNCVQILASKLPEPLCDGLDIPAERAKARKK